MSDARGPVRHGSRARRPARPLPPVRHAMEAEPLPSDDLQAVFAALARRSKLPTGPDARPAEVLRAAGIPLLMAALVAGGHVPATDGGDPGSPASAPPPGANGWTVTTLQPQGGSGAGTSGAPSAAATSPRSGDSSAPGAKASPGGAPSAGAKTSSGAKASAGAAASSGGTHHTPAKRPSRAAPPHRPPTGPREAPPPAPVDPPGKPRVTYTVRAGDTLASIAARSGRDADRIAEVNHLRAGQALVVGQVLVLPAAPGPVPEKPTRPSGPAPHKTTPPKAEPPKATPTKATPPKATPPKATPPTTTPPKTPTNTPPSTQSPATRTHVVRPGDTLTQISEEHKVKLAEVLALNHLTPRSVIHPGDRIVLPVAPGSVSARTTQGQPGAGTTAPAATRTYVVRSGDSLIGISAEQRVRLQEILELNHLHLESTIHPGDKLTLPAPPQAAATTPGHRTYPPAVVAAADANRRALAHARVPSRDQVKAMVVSTARSMGVDPALALGVAYLESGFQQRMVSPANAVGVMQVIPSAGRWASSMVGRPLDLLDTKDNITAGVALLRALVQASDTEAQAIAGYYQGLSSVQRNGMFDDTRRYVANVQTLKARFAAGT